METLFIIVIVRAKVTFEDNLNFQKKKNAYIFVLVHQKMFKAVKLRFDAL